VCGVLLPRYHFLYFSFDLPADEFAQHRGGDNQFRFCLRLPLRKRWTGSPLCNCIDEIRYPIAEFAWGYKDPAHFARSFKAGYGMPPGSFTPEKGA
jgi:hypothetical protein